MSPDQLADVIRRLEQIERRLDILESRGSGGTNESHVLGGSEPSATVETFERHETPGVSSARRVPKEKT
jgi:hypothetical protein